MFEYETNLKIDDELINDDIAKFEEAKKMQCALVLTFCNYVRARLMEHLGNPSASNALSEENSTTILSRLDRELDALGKEGSSYVYTLNDGKMPNKEIA